MTLCSGADQVTFTVVSAGTDGTAAGGVVVSEENDRGLCFHVEYHDFDLATCGDINGTDAGSRTDVDNALIDGDIIITTSGVTSYITTATASSRSISRPMDETTP